MAELLAELGALDVYVLPAAAGALLIEAREKAFWVAKRPARTTSSTWSCRARRSRSTWARWRAIAAAARPAWSLGCGHAGDGNVHLSVFQPDADRYAAGDARDPRGRRGQSAARSPASTASAREKKSYFLELEDPVAMSLMRRIKAAFDPDGILNPGVLLG